MIKEHDIHVCAHTSLGNVQSIRQEQKYLLAPYQCPGADSRVEARHVYILADA